MAELTEDERDMLRFEGQWFRSPGAKDAAIRAAFGIHPLRYYQRLHALTDRPEAAAAQPAVVRKLRAQRAARQRRLGRRAQT